MSDEKTHTERDLILAKREGYAQRMRDGAGWTPREIEEAAAKRYPLPKATRPRVLDSESTQYMVSEWAGRPRLYARDGATSEWRRVVIGVVRDPGYGSVQSNVPTAERLRALADLLANPTEEVDDAD